jgi:transposase
MMPDIKQYFLNPSAPRQKQYEAIRAVFVENLEVTTVAKRFGYTVQTRNELIRDVKEGKIELYPTIPRGPKTRHTPEYIQQLIFDYRKKNLSSKDICECCNEEGYKVSIRTVERILSDAGYLKLYQRTQAQRGLTKTGC